MYSYSRINKEILLTNDEMGTPFDKHLQKGASFDKMGHRFAESNRIEKCSFLRFRPPEVMPV